MKYQCLCSLSLQKNNMFLDIGVGIIFGVFFQQTEMFSVGFLLFCIISALLPDIDMLWFPIAKKFKRQNILGNHRSFTHYPILYIPISLFIYLFIDEYLGIIFTLLIFYHFVHDTFFIGWGVKWFWPFSLRSFKIFPDQNGKVTKKFMLSWLPAEDKKIKEWAGSSDWIKSFYMTINIVSVIEYSVFIFSVIYLVANIMK